MGIEHEKFERLAVLMKGCESVLVAFSGGVDSTFLLKVAHQVLGDRAVAATAVSASLSSREREEAEDLARLIGARHILIQTREIEREGYRKNGSDRCYHCKSELYDELIPLAEREGLKVIAYGEITDDHADWRPGRQAAREREVRAPLAEVGLSKIEIRRLSRELGLPTWDKPAFACLSSRIPFGTEVTVDRLQQVERAEEVLATLGFRQYRVRHHGEIARVELDPGDLNRAVEVRQAIVSGIQKAGFKHVALDLEGYLK
jgi:uncharacterized protein